MSVLTLEVPDKTLESLKAQAQKANTTVEQLAVSTLNKEAYLAQLREEVMLGATQLRNGQSTTYETAEDLIDDIIERGNKRLTERQNGTKP